MRSFEQRKAGIFRRSEARRRTAKIIRNRIIAVCIPLVLTITAAAVVGARAEYSINDAPTIENDLGNGKDHMASMLQTWSVEVQTEAIQYTFTEKEQVQNIASAINDLLTSSADVSQSAGAGNTIAEDFSSTSEAASCRITVITGSGSKNYTLAGNYLSEGSTNTRCLLTDEELTELKELLGLPPA